MQVPGPHPAENPTYLAAVRALACLCTLLAFGLYPPGAVAQYREVIAYRDFVAESNEPITVSQVMASQEAAGIKRTLPGGDPSLVIVPPLEQFRPDYTFLTPDKYSFDFVSIVAPVDAGVYLDGVLLGPYRCTITPTDGL